jgi:hypothetical protein
MDKIDIVDFNIFAPILVIIFAVIGWFLASGFGKTQYVRVIDVLLYGPYLIYLAFKQTYTFSLGEKIVLLFFGATTVTYNLRNFLGDF